jgi:hypothetical protein
MGQQYKIDPDRKSLVWLISLGNPLDGRYGKYNKQKVGEYTPGDDSYQFPVGIVLEHSGEPHIFTDYEGFEVGKNIVARKLYDTKDISHLEGELLTLADASFTDKNQREAFKSLLKRTLWKFNGHQEEKVEEIFKACD